MFDMITPRTIVAVGFFKSLYISALHVGRYTGEAGEPGRALGFFVAMLFLPFSLGVWGRFYRPRGLIGFCQLSIDVAIIVPIANI